MPRLLKAGDTEATHLRVYFLCVDATDGISAETGEAGGQPEISINGAAFASAGIGTLNAIGYGRYYADLASTVVGTAGYVIESRYKSANTAETPGDTFQIVGFDPASAWSTYNASSDGVTLSSGALNNIRTGLSTFNAANAVTLNAQSVTSVKSGLSTFNAYTIPVTLGASSITDIKSGLSTLNASNLSGLSTFNAGSDAVTLNATSVSAVKSGLSTFDPGVQIVTLGAAYDAAKNAASEAAVGALQSQQDEIYTAVVSGVTLNADALGNVRAGLSTFNSASDSVNLVSDQSSVTIGTVLNANIEASALTDAQNLILLNLNTLGATIGGMLEYSSGYRWTEKALEQAPAGAAGDGFYTQTLNFLTINDAPIQGAKVVVYSDEAHTDRAAGPLWSNVKGQVVFELDAGTYYSHAVHDTYTLPDTEFTVP